MCVYPRKGVHRGVVVVVSRTETVTSWTIIICQNIDRHKTAITRRPRVTSYLSRAPRGPQRVHATYTIHIDMYIWEETHIHIVGARMFAMPRWRQVQHCREPHQSHDGVCAPSLSLFSQSHNSDLVHRERERESERRMFQENIYAIMCLCWFQLGDADQKHRTQHNHSTKRQ